MPISMRKSEVLLIREKLNKGGYLQERQVILYPNPDGGYIVTVPSLRGCTAQGKTINKALKNIREEIEMHIYAMLVEDELVPEDVPGQISVSVLSWTDPQGQ
jgi:antitoxin HicB